MSRFRECYDPNYDPDDRLYPGGNELPEPEREEDEEEEEDETEHTLGAFAKKHGFDLPKGADNES